MIDPEKLVKLLMLSTSSEDAEALSAIRHANQLLLKSNLIWENVIKKGNYKKKRHVTPPQTRRQNPEPPSPPPKQEPPREEAKTAPERLDRATLETVFRFLMEDANCANSTSHQFVSNVYEYWTKYNKISEKQEFTILTIFKRFNNLRKN
jgi:hypothetical protein